jgi:hypothetical protein
VPRLRDLFRSGSIHGRVLVAVVGLGMVATANAACSTTGDADAGPAPSLQATEVADPADEVTNGIDDVAPQEALARAREALEVADSFRVTGSPSQGQMLDLVFVTGRGDSSARGALGTVTQGDSTFQLRAVDGAVYVRGDLDWLADEVAAGARRTLGGKWLLLPDSAATDLATVTEPAAFVEVVLVPMGEVQSVGASVIDEEPAVGIRFLDSEATAWLAGVGTPYPLLIERLGATADEGVVRFGAIDEPAALSAPRAGNVVVVPESTSR